MIRLIIILPVILGTLWFSSCSDNTSTTENTIADSLLPKGVTELNKKILDDPNNASLYHERGLIFLKNKLYTEAISDMQRAIKADSTNPEFYISLADVYLATNKTRGTKEALEKSIAIDPKNKISLMKLAELLFLVKSYEESLKYIDDILKLDQYNAKAYFMKGMNYLEKGDTNTAISSMQTAVEQDQKYYVAYMQIGWLYAEKKNKLAVEYYDNALKLQPHSSEALYGKAKFFQDQEFWNDAVITYNTLLSLDSNYRDAYYNLGAIELLTTKKYEKALTHFDKAIHVDPNYIDAYYARGTCFELLGNKKKAMENYAIALQLNPQYEPALTASKKIQGK